jgi:hypothetical protein
LPSVRPIVRRFALVSAAAYALALSACSSSSTPSTSSPSNSGFAQVRAVHGSPDAGPVDIYVYPGGKSRPTSPTVANAAYPQITNYLSISSGTYTIDVIAPAGSPSTATPVASESINVSSNTQYSVVVGGKVGAGTLRFVNFVEPAEVSGQTALLVHHASPYVQNALNAPVAIGAYDASQPIPALVPQIFSFSLASGTSGPAATGTVSGAEFYLSPLQAGALPNAVGFAAGTPAGSGNLSVLIYAPVSQLATGLKNPTSAQLTLAGDTGSTIAAGAHLSVFAVDTIPSAQLIGTLDP